MSDSTGAGVAPPGGDPTHVGASSMQVGGDHYRSKKIHPWDAMAAWMSAEAFAGFLHGNAIKYLARYRDKGGVEDLRKAQHYIAKLIEVENQTVDSGDPS